MKKIFIGACLISFFCVIPLIYGSDDRGFVYTVLANTYGLQLNSEEPENAASSFSVEINTWRKYMLTSQYIFQTYESFRQPKESADLSFTMRDPRHLEFFNKQLSGVSSEHSSSKAGLSFSLADKIDKTQTLFGRVMLHRELLLGKICVHATDKKYPLRNVAAVVFDSTRPVHEDIVTCCRAIARTERDVIAFWRVNPVLDQYAYHYPARLSLDKLDRLNLWIQRTPLLLSAFHYIELSCAALFFGVPPVVLYKNNIRENFPRRGRKDAFVERAMAVFLGSICVAAVVLMDRQYQDFQAILRSWEELFIQADELSRIVDNTPSLRELIFRDPHASFEILTNTRHPFYAELQEIRSLLSCPAVRWNSPAFFITSVGDAFSAYSRLRQLQDELAPLLEAIGLVDAYSGVDESLISSAGK